MNERIRQIRDTLELSRAAFGKRIGLSGDVINNLERGRAEVKNHIIKLICAEYSVNEDWLLNGNGPIFIESDTFRIEEFVKRHGGGKLEIDLLKAYFELDPELRKKLLQHFKSRIAANHKSEESAAMESITLEEAEKKYIKSRLEITEQEEPSVLNTAEEKEEIKPPTNEQEKEEKC